MHSVMPPVPPPPPLDPDTLRRLRAEINGIDADTLLITLDALITKFASRPDGLGVLRLIRGVLREMDRHAEIAIRYQEAALIKAVVDRQAKGDGA